MCVSRHLVNWRGRFELWGIVIIFLFSPLWSCATHFHKAIASRIFLSQSVNRTTGGSSAKGKWNSCSRYRCFLYTFSWVTVSIRTLSEIIDIEFQYAVRVRDVIYYFSADALKVIKQESTSSWLVKCSWYVLRKWAEIRRAFQQQQVRVKLYKRHKGQSNVRLSQAFVLKLLY